MRDTPAVRAAQAQRRRRMRIGVVVITVGVALFIIVVGLLAGSNTQTSEALGVEVARNDRLADDYGDLAARIAAVCAAGGPDVALDQAQICPLAQAAVANPEVNTGTLTREEVSAITQAAIAAQRDDVDMDAIVAAVLAAVRADPTMDGVDEATVRAIVEAAIAAQPEPVDGDDGAPGRNGSSFEGFERNADGDCVAVISTVAADGTESRATQPAGDAACPPRPADPDPGPAPEPEPTTPPDPEPELPTPSSVPQTSAEPPPLFGD